MVKAKATTKPTTTLSTSSKEGKNDAAHKEDVNDHLPPIFLVFTVLACSGFLFIYSFRDVFATGRVIGGARDHAYLVRREIE
jgi:hypothetical protein